MKKIGLYLILLLLVAGGISVLITRHLMPIPSDALSGLYYPFRDYFAKNYPNGIPFKNFLITDPVRQQYPWKNLVIEAEKKFSLPLWNPYNGLGTPLLANMQSGAWYPFNLLFFLFPFSASWSVYIFLAPLLGGLFMYLYLRQIQVTQLSALLGSVSFALSGFFISWFEWGNVTHTAMYLPLCLYAIEKMFSSKQKIWGVVLTTGGLVMSLFAGHLQTWFYLSLIVFAYYLFHLLQTTQKKKMLLWGGFIVVVVGIVGSLQLVPLFQFILLSARDVDVVSYQIAGWFIPYQHLVQFVAPDFFGNPATLNYFGVWNYAEMLGYVGIIPLFFVLVALIFRHQKHVFFWGSALLLGLVFAMPNPLSVLPFIWHVPFISSSQPTRLLFIVDSSLAILAAFGLDFFQKTASKKILLLLAVCLFGLLSFDLLLFFFGSHLPLSAENLLVAKRNMYLPTALFCLMSIIVCCKFFTPRKITVILGGLLIILTCFDLFHTADKFTPFTSSAYLYPTTTTIQFLQSHLGTYRYMTTDSRLMPPNVGAIFQLASADVYDPLYLRSFGEFVAASERNKPSITPPFGFNRIITPHNIESPLVNLMGVKYVLSLTDITNPQYKKVFQEGQTQVYENTQVLPRAFFVKRVFLSTSKQKIMDKLFDPSTNLEDTAVISEPLSTQFYSEGDVTIISYGANRILIQTNNNEEGFLVLTDTAYPTWHASIDGKETHIFVTDYLFRGIVVPKGKHTIVFQDSLF